jgi:hypothetical protein
MELKYRVKDKLLSINYSYDLLISIASPHTIHWGVNSALKINSKLTKKWIADCGDPFMLADNMQYKQPFYFKYLEKNFCKRADFITVPTINSYLGYYPEFKNKIITIPQGFKFYNLQQTESEKDKGGRIIIAYAGSLNEVRRNPTNFIKFLEKNNVNYTFYIFSSNTSIIKGLNHLIGNKIIISDYIPREKLLHELSKVDFLINFQNDGVTQVPSKLIDYSITGKPILSIKSNNFDEKIVNEFINFNFQNRLLINDIEQYKIENVVNRFLELANK